MKKLLLALILLISINSYAQEENVEYYDIQSVSYKIGMNKKEIIWSDWYKTEWNVRIDYYKEQQTITIIKEESDFYVIESYVDSFYYNDFTIYQFIANDRLDNKVTIEFMIPDNKDGFFIVITDKKNNIVMYKIK
jgi:hypothetical protein